jgi:hypothetical protein
MKHCTNCNEPLDDGLKFCSSCGADQSPKPANATTGNATLLIVLCVLTILGSMFTFARALIYEALSTMDESHEYVRGWIYAGTSILTAIGAIMMLLRKLAGLYTYTVGQVIYIITVIAASTTYEDLFDGSEAFVMAITMFFLVPAIGFLILYWTKMIRIHLK